MFVDFLVSTISGKCTNGCPYGMRGIFRFLREGEAGKGKTSRKAAGRLQEATSLE